MICPETRECLHAYLDNELDAGQRSAFEKHLHTCPECTRDLETQQALRAGLREPSFRFTVPAGLRQRILMALRPPMPAVRPGRPWISPALTAAASLLIGVAIGAVGGYYATPPPTPPAVVADLTHDVVDAHVRSLLGDHLIDKKSEDRHTVKPWLASQLDFSLPVNDFKEQGYPLKGGRLDFVNDRTAAVLIYDRGNHHINLFVWPCGEGCGSAVQETSQRGYTLLHWTQGGLVYWAVSDVNADDLRTFVRLVREAP